MSQECFSLSVFSFLPVDSLHSSRAAFHEKNSEATQRKVLANETEKVYVEIAFHAEQRTISRGSFASVGEALRDFGSVLGDSLAALITAVAAIIPWLIVIIPGLWFLIKAVRRFRERRRAAKAATPAG